MSWFGTSDGLRAGDRAPDFSLPDQTGRIVRLADLLARPPLVLCFYPRDFSPICTAQVCALRDRHAAFLQTGATVAGISGDAVERHQRFAADNRLPFPLLADAGNHVRKAWRVPSTLGVAPGRVTYIIDGQGIIRHVFSSQLDVAGHLREALEAVDRLRREAGAAPAEPPSA